MISRKVVVSLVITGNSCQIKTEGRQTRFLALVDFARFLTELDGVIVEEPSWMVKSCCRVWVAGKTRSFFRLPGRHFGMDERTSPTAQPGKDWASCLPCHSNSIAWFHHPARFFYNYRIKFSQKSWCNFRWPADFQRPHCRNCSILQVCTTQHQKDQALPYTASSSTSCPGPGHFYWTTAMLF